MTNPNPPNTLDEANENIELCPYGDPRCLIDIGGKPCKRCASVKPSPTKPDISDEAHRSNPMTNTDHNNNTEIEKILKKFDHKCMDTYRTRHDMRSEQVTSALNSAIGEATQSIEALIIKERQAELAQTILAGMPELTPKQQEFVENRLQALEKTLKEDK